MWHAVIFTITRRFCQACFGYFSGYNLHLKKGASAKLTSYAAITSAAKPGQKQKEVRTSNTPATIKSVRVDNKVVSTFYGPYAGQNNGTHNWAALFGTESAGAHNYSIEAVDSNLNSIVYSGTFNVVGANIAISSVVVAEAQPKNGALDPTDQLVITWEVDGADTVASKSLTVDGKTISTVYGPYGGAGGECYMAGIFGPLGAGSHSFSIQSGDSKGNVAGYTGSFNVVGSNVTISSVVVAEASSPKNGILEPSDQLVITWAVNGADSVKTKSFTVDSQTISTVYGPYAAGNGEFNLAGIFGPLARAATATPFSRPTARAMLPTTAAASTWRRH